MSSSCLLGLKNGDKGNNHKREKHYSINCKGVELKSLNRAVQQRRHD